MDGMLSQEEINALLAGGADNTVVDTSSAFEKVLTDEEKDAVGEISNICMGTAATTLSTLLNNKVVITTPSVGYTTLDELSSQYDRPCIFVQISTSGFVFRGAVRNCRSVRETCSLIFLTSL